MSETTWATDEDAKEAKKLLRKMNKARNFPTGTCPCSRHTALMAETLIKDRRYPMLLDEPVHCGKSLAVTVWQLWEARAALVSKDAEIERLREAGQRGLHRGRGPSGCDAGIERGHPHTSRWSHPASPKHGRRPRDTRKPFRRS